MERLIFILDYNVGPIEKVVQFDLLHHYKYDNIFLQSLILVF